MIGDAYFHFRAQIGTRLFSLAKLARDLAAPETALDSLQELQAELRTPFLFVTLGESGVGKSTVLNALFGRDFAGDPAFTGRAAVFRHSNETCDSPLSEDLVEAGRPHIFLRDFTIVDTAGFGSPASTPALLQRFVPAADVVLFVFPPRGDGRAAWDFLAHADRDHLQRFVFIVQQADTVEGDELMNVVLSLHDRLRSTLGGPRPVFAVSAQSRAGLDQLERYLETEVIGCPARFAKLREICVSADAMLFQLGAETREASETADRKLKYAEDQRLVLADARDEALRSLDRDLWSLAQLFEAAQRRGGELLRRRVSHHSLWAVDATWRQTFHREVETRVRESVLRNTELTAEHCDATLRSTWETQRAELDHCRAPGLTPFPDDSASHIETLKRGLTAADPEGAITSAVLTRLQRSRILLRLPLVLLAASAIALIVASIAGRHLLAAASFFTCAFAATIYVPTMLRGILAEALQTAMRARREAILSRVEAEMRTEVERVFRELQGSLAPLARAGADERAANQPLLDRILQLAEHFDHSIEEIENASAPPVPLSKAAA